MMSSVGADTGGAASCFPYDGNLKGSVVCPGLRNLSGVRTNGGHLRVDDGLDTTSVTSRDEDGVTAYRVNDFTSTSRVYDSTTSEVIDHDDRTSGAYDYVTNSSNFDGVSFFRTYDVITSSCAQFIVTSPESSMTSPSSRSYNRSDVKNRRRRYRQKLDRHFLEYLLPPVPPSLHHLLLTLIIVLLFSTSSLSVPFTCPTGCRCRDNQPYFIDCSNLDLNADLQATARKLPSDVVELEMSGNRMVDLNRTSLPVLPELRRLTMERCGVERLGRMAFRYMELLEILELARNRIHSIDDSAFQGLAELRDLDLSQNDLVTLPGFLFRSLSLRSLRLDGNQLYNIPDSIFEASQIRSLNLDGNRFESLSSSLLRPLGKSLTELSVSDNTVPLNIAADAFTLQNFTSLSLSSSNLTDPSFLAHTSAQILDLANNYFPYPTSRFPPSRLLSASCLQLRLSNSNLIQLDPNLIGGASLRRVRSLDLSSNRLSSLEDVAAMLRGMQYLEQLDLSGNAFLGAVFEENFGTSLGAVTTLNLSRSGLTAIDAGLFRGAEKLELVDLTYNRIQVLGVELAPFLDTIPLVDFTGNPFHCNCELLWFNQWLRARVKSSLPTSVVGAAKCVTPTLDGKSELVLSRRESEFVCTPPHVTYITANQNIDEGMELMLSCVVQSDPAADVVLSSPVGESFRITPPDNRTMTRTQANWKVRKLRALQSGWYTCTATNPVSMNMSSAVVRHTYIHVVTPSSPPLNGLEDLVYPDVPNRYRSTSFTTSTQRHLSTTPLSRDSKSDSTTEAIDLHDAGDWGDEYSESPKVSKLSEGRLSLSESDSDVLATTVSRTESDDEVDTRVVDNRDKTITIVLIAVGCSIIVVAIGVIVVLCIIKKFKHKRNKRYSVRRKADESGVYPPSEDEEEDKNKNINGKKNGVICDKRPGGGKKKYKTPPVIAVSLRERSSILHDQSVRSDRSSINDQSSINDKSILSDRSVLNDNSAASDRLLLNDKSLTSDQSACKS